jgi:hypothetical protein
MNGETYAEKLTWFKENERPEAVLRIVDEPELIKILIAWGHTQTTVKTKLTRLRGGSESDAWEWLWRNTEYSRLDLATRSGVPEYGLHNQLAVLIGNRAVYPDGTLNSFVERFLREEVVQLFDGPKGKSRRTAAKSH